MSSTRSTHFVSLLLLSAGSVYAAPASSLISAKVSFIEALAPRDTTSSERFRKDFESAIELAKRSLDSKLSRCGYRLKTQTYFYDASDPLQAKEQGEKAAQESTWLIVGPRRSNHYLLLAKGAPETPSVSLMASASDVGSLGALHLSLSPLNSEMAQVAAREALKKSGGKGRGFISIVSSDCVTCRDFADQFEKEAARIGLKRLDRLEVPGELPAPEAAIAQVKALKPSFVLLPNYSRVSSHFMAHLSNASPDLFFVGGDGWGDSKFGFVQNGNNIESARGFTVRGFPPTEQGLKAFPLGKSVLKDSQSARELSGPSVGILRILDSTADLLCAHKPKNAETFRAAFRTHGKTRFSSPWGVSIYSLSHGLIEYSSTRAVRR